MGPMGNRKQNLYVPYRFRRSKMPTFRFLVSPLKCRSRVLQSPRRTNLLANVCCKQNSDNDQNHTCSCNFCGNCFTLYIVLLDSSYVMDVFRSKVTNISGYHHSFGKTCAGVIFFHDKKLAHGKFSDKGRVSFCKIWFMKCFLFFWTQSMAIVIPIIRPKI